MGALLRRMHELGHYRLNLKIQVAGQLGKNQKLAEHDSENIQQDIWCKIADQICQLNICCKELPIKRGHILLTLKLSNMF